MSLWFLTAPAAPGAFCCGHRRLATWRCQRRGGTGRAHTRQPHHASPAMAVIIRLQLLQISSSLANSSSRPATDFPPQPPFSIRRQFQIANTRRFNLVEHATLPVVASLVCYSLAVLLIPFLAPASLLYPSPVVS
ncbi:hypothetical protein BGS_0303 [Beggiatoa sp. SS]|nr:hypothetical protein BGS_0303 [Beggiatoa sp. SS]